MLKAFTQAIPLLSKIEEAGYEAYFVGGSVRDYLLSKEIDDVDISTSATPEEIKNIFTKTVDVGIEHGTVLVLFDNQSYEITTFRSESDYEDYRRPSNVVFIRSLYEDLKRRDFTMNAIAMSKEGDLIDPFCGHTAIKMGVIQSVGNPEERFSEDALRIMRAIRFVSQLSFNIEEQTFDAVKKYGKHLENISIERKTKEFEKLLCGIDCGKAIKILVEADLHSFLPGLSNKEKELINFSNYSLTDLKLTEIWALLLFNLKYENTGPILKEWKLSNQKMKQIEKLLNFLHLRYSQPWNNHSLYQAGEAISISVEKIYMILQHNKSIIELEKLKKWYSSLPIKNLGELAVTGQDIMDWLDKPGGPWLKEVLKNIEEKVLFGNLSNKKEAIREWLFTCNPK